jgi:UDP-3-O-[3-hydroxymyristoyl] glucosamine N-acyltransferase
MEYTAKEIADILQGEIEGDPNAIIKGFSKIDESEKDTISFIANPKYTKFIYNTEASAVLVNKDFKATSDINSTLIKVDNAYHAFAKLLMMEDKSKIEEEGISKLATIKDSAEIGEGVYIGDHVFIEENARIGNNVKILPHSYIGKSVTIEENTVIYPDVKIYYDCEIGKNCVIHAGVIIGSDGFGFAPQSDNNYQKVPQVGNVIIEDNVDIGANTCLDRSTIGSTIIRKGVKLDNLIQIAHNVEIGENTVIAAQTGIAGSAKIGRDCMIGGQVGIVGHIKVGDGAKIAAQSGVSSNVKAGEVVQGAPAFDFGKYQKSYVLFRKLPDIYKKITELEKEIENLKKD